MGDRRGQFDVAHPLAAHFRQRDLDAALLADDAAELHPLVLAAQALVVLDRAKDAGAEQAVALRLEGAVVDGFGLLDLAERPGADLLRAGDLDLDLVECHCLAGLAEDFHQLVHAFDTLLSRGCIEVVVSMALAARVMAGAVPRQPRLRSDALAIPSNAAWLGSKRAGHDAFGTRQAARLSRSTFRPSDFNSLTSTLKLSGMPASKLSCSRTIAS